MITQSMALSILTELVKTPSYIGDTNPASEKNLETLLKKWFATNLPKYKFITIPFAKNRNNLLFYKNSCRWLFACHMDTVPPFSSKDLTVIQKEDKIFGLGTKDMKGGITSTLLALLKSKDEDVDGGVLFYGDEEYDQKGIQALVKETNKIPKPKLIISPESRYNLGIGARGMCVIDLTIKGQRAHSSRPHLGVDAIKSFYKMVVQLEKRLSKATQLGKTTVTITRLQGGLLVNSEIDFHHGTIPDCAEGTISIRVSQPNLNSKKILGMVKELVKHNGASLQNFKVLSDYPTRLCKQTEIKPIIEAIKKVTGKVEFSDPSLAGYNDVAILSRKLNLPLVNFGPYGENNHSPDEWVSLNSILKTADIYINLLKN